MTARAIRPGVWLALATPPLAWFGYQQGLGVIVRVDCAAGGGVVGLGLGAAALAACAVAAAAGWRSARSEDQVSGFLGRIILWGSLLFALAIVFQIAAAMIVPSCAR